ncbi:DUF3618 domain-containing protein [Tessaracoccus antarcticus]|uniref:DUF3618 domain-containing protein n=1 Tax=Tessaracoccus antarcticus TaxID=2479848 RepID=A0A3M0GBC7_9ACTN|nr:DUF3618 domain-containing protein [Tessaracoccus antarcticus]RMB62321.1 DUF3618 domain-containing protein [Tessaracoccus antarcticus]
MAKDKARSITEIRADLARNRVHLADSVGEFVDEVNPKNVAKRGVENAKSFAASEFDAVKAEFKDEHGWRTDRLVVIGGALLGIVVFAITLKSISNARNKSLGDKARKAIMSIGE